MTATTVSQRDIFLAQQTIAPITRRTPLIKSDVLSERVGADVYLKLEIMQQTGAFKARGAANRILSLPAEAQQRGVVTVSTGNHGRAVAYVARHLGIKATVCLSELVPQNKVEALRQLGAELVIHGRTQDEATEYAENLARERGYILIHPFDDPHIIAGQGTIGLEILQELPQVDTVLVPLSGGGLMSGIALAIKSASSAIRTIGITMEQGAAMYESLKAGKPIFVEEYETLADSLGGGIGLDNRYTFDLVQRYVDDAVLVSEQQIAEAMAFGFMQHQIVIEGGGSVGIAALLANKAPNLGEKIVVVVSGGNVDVGKLLKIVAQQRAAL